MSNTTNRPEWLNKVNLERPQDGNHMVKLSYELNEYGVNTTIYFPTGETLRKFFSAKNGYVENALLERLKDWFGGNITDPIELLEKATKEAFPVSYRYDDLQPKYKDILYVLDKME